MYGRTEAFHVVVSWANAWHRGRCSVLASHGSARLKHGELGAQEAAGVAGGQVHAQGAGALVVVAPLLSLLPLPDPYRRCSSPHL